MFPFEVTCAEKSKGNNSSLKRFETSVLFFRVGMPKHHLARNVQRRLKLTTTMVVVEKGAKARAKRGARRRVERKRRNR